MAYLDDTGLAHFWDKIKQWIASAASNLVHRTGAETVDGLKTFVSSETFPDAEAEPLVSQITEIVLTNNTVTKGTPTLDRNSYTQIVYTDSSGDIDSGRTLSLFYHHPAVGDSRPIAKFALDYINNDNVSTRVSLDIGYDPDNGVAYATAPATSSSRSNSTDIVTRGWIQNDTRIVHTTGTETIDGAKYFSSSVCVAQPFAKGTNPTSTSYKQFNFTDSSNVNSASTRAGCLESVLDSSGGTSLYMRSYKWEANSSVHAYLDLRYPHNGTPTITTNASISTYAADGNWLYVNHPDMVKGTLPATQKSFWAVWSDSVGNAGAANAFAVNWIGLRTSGETVWRMSVSRNVANGDDWASLELVQKADGTKYATAPSTPASGNNNDIVTRDFIASDSRVVHTTGEESVNGAKYFTDSVRSMISTLTKGTLPSSNVFSGWYAYDKNKTRIFGVEGCYRSDTLNSSDIKLFIYGQSTSTWHFVNLKNRSTGVHFSSDSNGSITLGESSIRWKEVWCTQSSINSSSDEREKNSIASIPDAVLDAWLDVSWCQYKFNDAVAEKGDASRLHTGLVAQDIDRVFRAKGLDVSGYGLFLYDEWGAEPEERDSEGRVMRQARPAGDAYGLRYVEALCMEAACMRRENVRLKERVADLEERLAALELRLGSE